MNVSLPLLLIGILFVLSGILSLISILMQLLGARPVGMIGDKIVWEFAEEENDGH